MHWGDSCVGLGRGESGLTRSFVTFGDACLRWMDNPVVSLDADNGL